MLYTLLYSTPEEDLLFVFGLFYVLVVFFCVLPDILNRCLVGCVESVNAFCVLSSIGAFPVWPGYNLIKCAIYVDLFQARSRKALPK